MAHEIIKGMDISLTRNLEAPAWHGLDKRFDEITLATLQAEGFGRPTQMVPAAAVDPVSGATVISDEHRAIVAPTLDRSAVKVVSIVGTRYQMAGQNGYLDTLGRVIKPLMDQGLISIVSAGTLRGYQRAYLSTEIKGAQLRAAIRGNDDVTMLLNFADSLDGSLRVMQWDSITRIVCANTLAMSLGDGTRKRAVKHTAGMDLRLDKWTDLILAKQAELDAQAAVYRQLAAKQITPNDLDAYLRECFNVDEATKNPRGSFTQAVEAHDADPARGTLWGAYNAAQATLQWFSKQGRTTEARLDNVWFGQGANQNQTFLNAALARL